MRKYFFALPCFILIIVTMFLYSRKKSSADHTNKDSVPSNTLKYIE